ncbi:MAG: prepilin-type N-terminal cleavage/methylation domain-containing protein [Elusimicrobia bacterium]|nr:prepilin-type N-terminal cleavage/methylation domain-containing protein [Elusimicrobiota bacterium]
MRAARGGGFSLIEVVVALALASTVFLAVTALFSPMIRTQVKAMNGLYSQGEALIALKAMNRSIARASEIHIPAAAEAGDVLSGCINYDSTRGSAIDAAQATRMFYYCLEGGNLYRYSVDSLPCPMPPPAACAAGGTLIGRNVSCAGDCFTRRSGIRNVVRLNFTSVFGETRQDIDTAVAFQGVND